jgi:hypothetical protein
MVRPQPILDYLRCAGVGRRAINPFNQRRIIRVGLRAVEAPQIVLPDNPSSCRAVLQFRFAVDIRHPSLGSSEPVAAHDRARLGP